MRTEPFFRSFLRYWRIYRKYGVRPPMKKAWQMAKHHLTRI